MKIDDQIKEQLTKELLKVTSPEEVEQIRIRYLGKKGFITTINKMTNFKLMNKTERKDFGQSFNEIKAWAESTLAKALFRLAQAEDVRCLPFVDLTLPGRRGQSGSLHPITLVQMELEQIFQSMSFFVDEGYHIETEYYNFDTLNIPSDHPAREMQDTFWLTNTMLMRTHTSANQVRMLERYGVPLRAIFPGRCFRYEAVDASHENTFYQLEGLMVDL